MTHKIVTYSRVSSEKQDFNRQKESLIAEAKKKQWVIQRHFAEKISGTVKTSDRRVFEEMVKYIKTNDIDIVMISEISRIARRVILILESFERLHKLGISVYVQQLGMSSLNEDGSENQTFKMLLHMMSLGSELENDLRKSRQREGIALARIKYPERYSGRKRGADADRNSLLKKYNNIVDLLNHSELSLRRISKLTGHSVNTVRKD